MNKDDKNWIEVEKFFGSKVWDDLMDEALEDKDSPAKELMDDIMLRFQTVIFRATIGDLIRFNKEVADLSTITKYVNKVYEQ